jgi:LmbE family N-acetylglucosaminyl deacetylase
MNLVLPAGPLTVLCLGAHPDDIEIGCGGTILTLAATGRVTATHVLLTGSPKRQHEARSAAELFWAGAPQPPEVVCNDLPDGRLPGSWDRVKQFLEEVASNASPDLILAPRADDAHQDHRLIAQLVPTVWRNSLLLHYEIPKWDGDRFPVTHFIPVTPDLAMRKVRLLDEAYGSQRHHDWWDEETFLGLMRLRGVECRARYAEGFVSAKTLVSINHN